MPRSDGRFQPDLRIAVRTCITNISLDGLERLAIALSVDVLYIMAHIDTPDLEATATANCQSSAKAISLFGIELAHILYVRRASSALNERGFSR